MDVSRPLVAFAHAHVARLDAHQGKGALGHMRLYGDGVCRSAARSPHRVKSILGIGLGYVKEGNARCVLTPSPCGDGHKPAAKSRAMPLTSCGKNGSPR